MLWCTSTRQAKIFDGCRIPCWSCSRSSPWCRYVWLCIPNSHSPLWDCIHIEGIDKGSQQSLCSWLRSSWRGMQLLGLHSFHSCLSSHDRKARYFLPSSLDAQHSISIQPHEGSEKGHSNWNFAWVSPHLPQWNIQPVKENPWLGRLCFGTG